MFDLIESPVSYPDYDEERLTLSDSEGLIPKLTDRSKRFDCRQNVLFSKSRLKMFRIDRQDLFAITEVFTANVFQVGLAGQKSAAGPSAKTAKNVGS